MSNDALCCMTWAELVSGSRFRVARSRQPFRSVVRLPSTLARSVHEVASSSDRMRGSIRTFATAWSRARQWTRTWRKVSADRRVQTWPGLGVFGRGQGSAGRLSAECEHDVPDASSTLGCSGGPIGTGALGVYRDGGGSGEMVWSRARWMFDASSVFICSRVCSGNIFSASSYVLRAHVLEDSETAKQ